MKVVELFAGIGGFKLGVEQVYPKADFPFVSEWDKFAQKSYEVMHGIIPHGDITKVNETDVPDHDLLVGGFPCQSFSVAGQRKGFEDTRGTLFFDMARIAKEKQPKVILAENVKGLVGHDKGRTLDVMVETLNEIGYTVDFEVLNSKYYGVPQNRERIFIIGVRNDLIEHEEWIISGNTVVPKGKKRIQGYGKVRSFNFDWPTSDTVTKRLKDVLEHDVDEKYYLDDEKTSSLIRELENGLAIREATKKGYTIAADGDSVNIQFPNSTTRRGRVGKGVANTLEASGVNQGVVESNLSQLAGNVDNHPFSKKREFNNFKNSEITPTLIATDYKAPKCVLEEFEVHHKTLRKERTDYGKLVRKQYENGELYESRKNMTTHRPRPDDITNTITTVTKDNYILENVRAVITPDRVNKRQNGRRFKEVNEEMFTLTSQDRHGVLEELPMECNIDIVGNVSNTGHGNMNVHAVTGVSPTVAARNYKGAKLIADEIIQVGELDMKGQRSVKAVHSPNGQCPTLTTMGGGHREPKIAEHTNKQYRIRKLTPKECWRLQGFPDELHDAVERSGVSNSQRYKQAGNAVTVNVITAIMSKIKELNIL